MLRGFCYLALFRWHFSTSSDRKIFDILKSYCWKSQNREWAECNLKLTLRWDVPSTGSCWPSQNSEKCKSKLSNIDKNKLFGDMMQLDASKLFRMWVISGKMLIFFFKNLQFLILRSVTRLLFLTLVFCDFVRHQDFRAPFWFFLAFLKRRKAAWEYRRDHCSGESAQMKKNEKIFLFPSQ